LLTRRALLMLLAGASLFLILLGPLDVPAAAADTTSHSGAVGPRDGSNWRGDPDEHCHNGWSDEPGGDDHCCAPPPASAPTPTPAPAPTAAPKHVPTRTPRRPRPVLVVPSRWQGESTSASSATSAALPASGSPTSSPAQRPPVLAPPALAIPSISPVNAGGPVGGAVDVIALSTVLVVATIAVASLVLVRRSG